MSRRLGSVYMVPLGNPADWACLRATHLFGSFRQCISDCTSVFREALSSAVALESSSAGPLGFSPFALQIFRITGTLPLSPDQGTRGKKSSSGAVSWGLLTTASSGWHHVIGIADQGVNWAARCPLRWLGRASSWWRRVVIGIAGQGVVWVAPCYWDC